MGDVAASIAIDDVVVDVNACPAPFLPFGDVAGKSQALYMSLLVVLPVSR